MSGRWALGSLLLGLLPSPLPQGTLQEAQIRVELGHQAAEVTARYRIVEAPDSVRLVAIRFPGQELALNRSAAFGAPDFGPGPGTIPGGPGWGAGRLDTLPGLLRLTVPARRGSLELELRYAVTGELARVPLFVPEAPTRPGESRVHLVLSGPGAATRARFPFPRLARDRAGGWEARPDHLPSFVTLAAGSGTFAVPALANASVVLVAVLGTAIWLWTRRPRRA